MVWEAKDTFSRKKSRLGISPHLIHDITAMIQLKYCCYGLKQQENKEIKICADLRQCALMTTLYRFPTEKSDWQHHDPISYSVLHF